MTRYNKFGGFSRYAKVGAYAALVIALIAIIVLAFYTDHEREVKPVKSSSASASLSSSLINNGSEESRPAATTTKIPILMYHSIAYQKGNILRVPQDKFTAEMKWLYDNGYKTLTLDELYDGISKNKPFPEKSVCITFDDGYNDNYDSAFPVLKQYKFKATVFMISDKIDDAYDGYLTSAQLKEMDKDGMQIECHTVDHKDLDTLSYKKQLSELTDSKAKLEALLGRKVDYIAYPSGKYDDNTIKAAKQVGYKICFKMNGGIGKIGDNVYEFPRTFVGENLQDFINRVHGNISSSSSASSSSSKS